MFKREMPVKMTGLDIFVKSGTFSITDVNYRQLYCLGPHVTIDEMLQKFRRRCKFRQYMPSKPGRYGIKYWILADVENHYCYNAIPCLGKETEFPAVNLGAQVVKSLVEPIKGANRNIPCDRYFASVDLFEELFQDKLTATTKASPRSRNWI